MHGSRGNCQSLVLWKRKQADNAQYGEDSPVPLPVGHIIGTDKVQLALADDTDIHVTAGAQIVVDASCNGISHKLFGFLFLEKQKKAVTTRALAFHSNVCPRDSGSSELSVQ